MRKTDPLPAGQAKRRRGARRSGSACVLGDLDLIRPLALAGIPSAVVCAPGDPERRSRWVTHALDEPADWRDAEEILDQLVAYGLTQPEPPVLYYQGDQHLLFVSHNRERLASAFRFVIAPADQVEDLVDKARFRALADRLGLPVPPSTVLAPVAEPAPPTGLSYPVVVKPLHRADNAWTGVEPSAKAVRVATRADLEALWPHLAASGRKYLAQEVVPGPETLIVSYHSYNDTRGAVVAEFTGRKLRTRPLEYGHTTALTITDDPDVAAAGRAVIRSLGLTGVSKVDFKRGPDGSLRLLEVNPRFNLWHYPGAVAGVNIPAIVHADLTGRPRPPVGRARDGVCWCSVSDAKTALTWGVPLRMWLLWALRCEAKSVWARDDPVPFLLLAASRARGLLPARWGGG